MYVSESNQMSTGDAPQMPSTAPMLLNCASVHPSPSQCVNAPLGPPAQAELGDSTQSFWRSRGNTRPESSELCQLRPSKCETWPLEPTAHTSLALVPCTAHMFSGAFAMGP